MCEARNRKLPSRLKGLMTELFVAMNEATVSFASR